MAHDRLWQKPRPHGDLAVYSEVGRLLGTSQAPTSDGVAQHGGTAEVDAEANENSWRKVTTLLDGSLSG